MDDSDSETDSLPDISVEVRVKKVMYNDREENCYSDFVQSALRNVSLIGPA